MKYHGRVHKYGDHINTDLIIPGKYLHNTDPVHLAKHALEGLDPDFCKNFKAGDILVAGRHFGCGSSREQAAICLKHRGVTLVIAESFARIFYRNAINQGIYLIEAETAVKNITSNDVLTVDTSSGVMCNHTKNSTMSFPPLPDFLDAIIRSDGLIPYLQQTRKTK